MSAPYEEALTEAQKAAVRNLKCPLCGHDIAVVGRYVDCTKSYSEDEFGEPIEGGCPFYTSRVWIKYQLGSDPFPPPEPLRPLKRK